jgi:hypothetical protein
LRERGGEKKSSQKKKNTRCSFISRDFLIESERIRRFRREEQKSLTHSFVRLTPPEFTDRKTRHHASGEEENESAIVVVQRYDDGESGGRENSLALGDAKEIRLRWFR